MANNFAEILKKSSERESQFELIRLVAQFFIIVYHIFLFFIYPQTGDGLHKAIWLPLHVGVILFILISGWFTIKCNLKSFLRLVMMMAILYFPMQLLWIGKTGLQSDFDLLRLPFFITWSPFWFMRTYVFLFLISPLLNFILSSANLKNKIYLLIVLFFMSCYIGTWGSDGSLIDGKNVVTFAFIYTIGYMLRDYRKYIDKIRTVPLLAAYLCYNVTLVVLFSTNNPIANSQFVFNRIFFSYASIGLLVNALMLFLLLSRLSFKSKWVNIAGGASLTMYMVHSANLVLYIFIAPIVEKMLSAYHHNSGVNECVLVLKVTLLTIVIMCGCTIVHYVLMPVAYFCADRIYNFVASKRIMNVVSANLHHDSPNHD